MTSDVTSICMLAVLVLALVFDLAGRAIYRLAYARGEQAAHAAQRALADDPATPARVWHRMIANAVKDGVIPSEAMVTEKLHVWHRVDVADRHTIITCLRAAFELMQLRDGAPALPPAAESAPSFENTKASP